MNDTNIGSDTVAGAFDQEEAGRLSAPTAVDAKRQLVLAKDERLQRWGVYFFLLLSSAAFLLTFLFLVISAWQGRTESTIIAFGKIPASTTALIGAIVASLVAVPLSFCIALAKLLSPESKIGEKDSSNFTSAFFELGKALAQGFNSFKPK
ncbi:hypothetical protein [Xanthomonas citri]|uniref:hypothetical protein n=1 Tax=Xanthomonas citri TaxID=346 RepID=UPI00103BE25D|nr:hypothetical protein [Xanthomonas citri]